MGHRISGKSAVIASCLSCELCAVAIWCRPAWLKTRSTAALEAGTSGRAVLVRIACSVQYCFVPRMSYNHHRCQWAPYPDTSSAAVSCFWLRYQFNRKAYMATSTKPSSTSTSTSTQVTSTSTSTTYYISMVSCRLACNLPVTYPALITLIRIKWHCFFLRQSVHCEETYDGRRPPSRIQLQRSVEWETGWWGICKPAYMSHTSWRTLCQAQRRPETEHRRRSSTT